MIPAGAISPGGEDMKLAVARDVGASLCVSTAFLSLLSAGTALAQTNIGSAIAIEREVSGSFGGQTRSLATGDGVVSNENIRTANASTAQLQFLDESKMTIGPTSSVVLDKFVYNPDHSARAGTVEMSIGAARWIGAAGKSDEPYKIQTPHAVIGVRGTEFDLLVEIRQTIVTLRGGVVIVCLARMPGRCVTMTTPGTVVVVTLTDIRGPTPTAPSPTQFADNCLSPIERRLSFCETQAFAGTLNPTNTSVAAANAGPLSGFYAGVNAGYGAGSARTTTTVSPFTQNNPFAFIFPGGSDTANVTPVGPIGGIQFGYNMRLAPFWIVGVEADIQASGQTNLGSGVFSGTIIGPVNPAICSSPPCVFTNTTDVTARLSWFGTARARAGAELNGIWLYGTGGLAYGRVSVSGMNTFSVNEGGGPFTVYQAPFSFATMRTGYAAGVGAVGRLGPGPWMWTVEYLHIDLGSIGAGPFASTSGSVTGSVPVVNVTSGRITDDILRVGVDLQLFN
jgi:hypothetical protein